MGVFALKKLMKDIQEVCEIGGRHMDIAMPGLLKTHALKHKQIKDAIESTDSNAVSKYVRNMGEKAKLRGDDIRNLPGDVGDLVDSVPGRNSLREAMDSLKLDHAHTEALRENIERTMTGKERREALKELGLSDVEKLANQYAKRVLGHYSDPSSQLGMAKTAANAALAELGATYSEDVAPEIRNAAIEHIFNETVAGSVTVNGHDITLQEFKDYINEVKK